MKHVADSGTKLHCGVIKFSGDRTLLSLNDVLARWLGATPDTFAGTPMDDILAPGTRLFWETTISPMLWKSKQALDVAIEVRGPKGPVNLVGNVVADGDNFVGLFLRFDLRREFERQLAIARGENELQKKQITHLTALNRMRMDFINSAAHEIATPLTPMLIQLHLLDMKVPAENEVARDAIAIIRGNLQHLGDFSEDLRHAAIVERLHFPSELPAANLLELVGELVGPMKLASVSDDSASSSCSADLSWAKVVLEKLLENAIKFGQGTAVKVRVESNPPQVIITDGGVGIDPAKIPLLGHPFAQMHDKNKFTTLGPGLGLYIASAAMKAMGGELQLTSGGEGQGFTAVAKFKNPV